MGEGGDVGGLKLSPALVERRPDDDAGVIAVGGDDVAPLLPVVLLCLGAADGLGLAVPVGHIPRVVVVGYAAARHVLPYHEADAVAVFKPQVGLYLHVLAHHVESPFLGLLEIVDHSLVGGGCVDAVGPVALVERAHLEEGFVVEHHDHVAVLVAALGYLAHGGVAAHCVDGLALGEDFDLQGVEERAVGAPELGLRDVEVQSLAAHSLGRGYDGLAVLEGHSHLVAGVCATAADPHADVLVVEVGDDLKSLDVLTVYRFHPHGLPDAGGGSVPDAPRLALLLPDGLIAVCCRVEYFYREAVGAGLEGGGDVEAEGSVAAGVRAHSGAVDVHVSLPVDRAEVEFDVLALPRGGDGEAAAVPEGVVLGKGLADAREGTLDGVGHKDLAVPRGRFGIANAFDGVVPEAVEVNPGGALHLRAWVHVPREFGVYFLSPRGLYLIARRMPLSLCAGQSEQDCGSCGCHQSFYIHLL